MNILYVITILATYVLFMLVPKTEKKQNLLGWSAISAIIMLCYNILICLILTFFNQLCTLLNLSICNAIISAIFAFVVIKKKKIQKYTIKISDIIFTIILLVIIAVTAYTEYGFPFKIKYKITDGSTHYFYAEQFYETSTLLYKGENNDIFELYESDFRLPASYINEGIGFKVFDNIIDRIDIFIYFDLFVLFLSGILFYHLLNTHLVKENKKLKLIASIFALIYVLAYQINSMIYGFVYLSLSLDIIIAFLIMMASYEKKEMANMIILPILSLLSFGIFFSYAYFIPILYIAIIVNIIAKYVINEEKVLSEKNILTVMWTLVNPLILGITYFIILPNIKGIQSEISTLGLEGVSYENTITNLLAFIPILIAGIAIAIKNKNKRFNYSTVALIVSLVYVVILFAGNKLKLVSAYYCYKAYYLIWILVLYVAYKIIVNLIEKERKEFKIATYAYVGVYVLAIIVSTVMLKDIKINNIFYHNADIITDGKHLMLREQLRLLEEVQSKLENDEVYVLSSRYEGRMKWMGILFDKHEIYKDIIEKEEIVIQRWLDEKQEKYYAAYYEDYEKTYQEPNLDENSEQYSIIYQDEYGFILERK